VFIGLVALLSEVHIDSPQSMLILPQILQNYRQQSTKGLSRPLVALNLSGDIFKLIYFLMKVLRYQTTGSSLPVHHVRHHPSHLGQFGSRPDLLLQKAGR
jgi:hypothetical protein